VPVNSRVEPLLERVPFRIEARAGRLVGRRARGLPVRCARTQRQPLPAYLARAERERGLAQHVVDPRLRLHSHLFHELRNTAEKGAKSRWLPPCPPALSPGRPSASRLRLVLQMPLDRGVPLAAARYSGQHPQVPLGAWRRCSRQWCAGRTPPCGRHRVFVPQPHQRTGHRGGWSRTILGFSQNTVFTI